jgi:simple sugar transport system ATP-binding protein
LEGEDAVLPGRPAAHGAHSPVKDLVLELEEVAARNDHGVFRLQKVSIEVGRGEIVGVAGVEGNGQAELIEVLLGLRRVSGGTIKVCGVDVTDKGPAALTAAGVRVITDDRHTLDLVLDMSVTENLIVDRLNDPQISRWGFLNRSKAQSTARDLMTRFAIQSPSPDTPMRYLSGGNQQRAVLARELSAETAVLVASQPTAGLDVGAIEEVTDRLLAARAQGVGILLITSDLAELLAISDRITILTRGRIVANLPRDQASATKLGAMLGGLDEPEDVLDVEQVAASADRELSHRP